jgi:hypothetical protein
VSIHHGKNYLDHNHPPAVDPFLLYPHRERVPGRKKALEMASDLRGIVSWAEAKAVLDRKGLRLTRSEFYNCLRKEGAGEKMDSQQELQYIVALLEEEGFHVAVREVYLLGPNREPIDRVVRDIFFIHPEQIRLGQRFASDWVYITDATFNTNELRLPLSNMVSIDNTGKTFLLAQDFIVSESAESFQFVQEGLSKFVFHCCPEPAVIAGDFSKGLAKAVALKARKDVEAQKAATFYTRIVVEASESSISSPSPEPQLDSQVGDDEETITVEHSLETLEQTVVSADGQQSILQCCSWHAATAIKRRLIHRGYRKEKREEIETRLWRWIQAETDDELLKARTEFMRMLRAPERQYILTFYQPKEPQFVHRFTRYYRNLGIHSTQRGESYHHYSGRGLYKNLLLSSAIKLIAQNLKKMAQDYDDRINNDRRHYPRLIDKTGFKLIYRKLTIFCLDIAMAEWNKAKALGDRVKDGEDLQFNELTGCARGCDLPVRQGIPCYHWMCYFYLQQEPLPLLIFHPRWLLDGPPFLQKRWVMTLPTSTENPEVLESPAESLSFNRYAGDKFVNRGAEVIIKAALKAAAIHTNLPPGEATKFAAAFERSTAKLNQKQEEIVAKRQILPAHLPKALRQPKLIYGKGRKRALTGLESAELQEAEELRKRRQVRELSKREEASILQQESQDQANKVATYSQRFVRGNLMTSGDSQANSIVLSSSDSDEELSIGSAESDFVDVDDDDEIDVIPATQLPGLTSTAPLVSTASKAKKTRQRKH